MPTNDNAVLALLEAMDDELKVKLTRIADRDRVSVEDLVVKFLTEGVNTYPGFLASYSKPTE